jgi:hypothetical protein
LDLTSSPFTLLRYPGRAKKLVNMEPALSGGYKKIYGYAKFGTAQVTGSSDTILGIKDYADGVFACADTGIWFSTDGVTWVKVNKDGASAGLNLTNLNAAAELTRSTTARYQIVTYEGSEEYGIVVAVNGSDEAAWIKFTGSGGGRTYFYKELTNAATGAPTAPSYAEILKERLFLSGDSTNPNRVYWSDRYKMDDFLGSGAGFIDIADEVTGIKAFREQLVIFGKNSIYTLSGFDGGLTLKPVTRNVGCINGFTIQEFGSNLLFLARDGIRTVAATDRIGDLELGVISRNITPLVADVIGALGTYDVSSVTIKKRNQYRFFYNSSGATSKAILGTLRYTPDGVMSWEWGEIEGWDAPAIVSSSGADEAEDIYHGGYDGYIYKENTSGSFDGVAYKATYKTVEMDIGDIGMRKTFHELSLSTNAEGTLTLTLTPEYDFADNTIHQPSAKTLSTIYSASLFGSAIFGTDRFGASQTPIININLEGSGYSATMKFETNDTNSPYTIGGFFIDFIASGRR